MGSTYPDVLDDFPIVRDAGDLSGPDVLDHADALNKIEAELGAAPSGGEETVRARLEALDTLVASKASAATAATDAEVAAAIAVAVATLTAAIAAKQDAATAATDVEVNAAVAALDAAKQNAATAATDVELAAAVAALNAAVAAVDLDLDAQVAALTAALALKQASATAATDAELAALDAAVQDALDDLDAEIATKQAAATAATDAELEALDDEIAGALVALNLAKQDAATAATDAEVASAVAALAATVATDAELALHTGDTALDDGPHGLPALTADGMTWVRQGGALVAVDVATQAEHDDHSSRHDPGGDDAVDWMHGISHTPDSDPWFLGLPVAGKLSTIPRVFATDNTAALLTGVLYLMALPVWEGLTLNALTAWSGTQAAVAPTNHWACLVNQADRALLAISNDLGAAAWTAITPKTFTFTAPYVVPAGVRRIYAGLMVKATTPPSSIGRSLGNTLLTNTVPRLTARSSTGLTDPASCPNPVAALSDGFGMPYILVT